MKNSFNLILFSILMTGCGFSSGLYQDIIKAQKSVNQQEFKKAARIYENILIKKPSKTIAIKINYQLGDIYSIYLGNYQKSLEHYQIIVDTSNEPNWQVKSLERIATVKFENLKDYRSAEKIFFILTEFRPVLKKQIYYRYMHALSIFNQKSYTKAIKLFKELLNTTDKKVVKDSQYHLGLSFYYKREWNNALREWNSYLSKETNLNKIVNTKFLIANAFESSEKLKEAYNVYYSILADYPNPDIIKSRLESLYQRRIARKR